MEKRILSPCISLQMLSLDVLIVIYCPLNHSSPSPFNNGNQSSDWTYHTFATNEDDP